MKNVQQANQLMNGMFTVKLFLFIGRNWQKKKKNLILERCIMRLRCEVFKLSPDVKKTNVGTKKNAQPPEHGDLTTIFYQVSVKCNIIPFNLSPKFSVFIFIKRNKPPTLGRL